jgi:exopolysaccharide/PEP-CTERM locus tyrosine autokinase
MKSTIEKALDRAGKKAPKKETVLPENVNDSDEKRELREPTTTEVHESPAKVRVESEKPIFVIDEAMIEEKGMVSVSGNKTLINEEYREIKRTLLSNGFGPISKTLNNSNIIMVSSARPSEGKTFNAINLALSIAAEQDKTVLLVDADVLKPSILSSLELEERKGLMEYLTGEVKSISDVLYHTSIDKLKIVPAGRTHRLSTELLASQKMHETIDEFANRYPDRVVIIDTPPLIGITESAVLANFAGQAVVVVEENRSKMHDIQEAVKRLNPEMAIGFVVNKSVNSEPTDLGYYGYHNYNK